MTKSEHSVEIRLTNIERAFRRWRLGSMLAAVGMVLGLLWTGGWLPWSTKRTIRAGRIELGESEAQRMSLSPGGLSIHAPRPDDSFDEGPTVVGLGWDAHSGSRGFGRFWLGIDPAVAFTVNHSLDSDFWTARMHVHDIGMQMNQRGERACYGCEAPATSSSAPEPK